MPARPCAARWLTLAAALGLSACAGAGPEASFAERDPYEDVNRDIHEFNLVLDRNVLRPVSQGYETVTPTLFQHLLRNAFNHLDTVNDFANYTLQGEAEPALTALGRFTLNTVLGAAGLLDPATEFGLPKEDTDFGVTLGKHGVGEGAFLMLPFFGPSTTRDLAGQAGDFALSPETYINPAFNSDVLNFVSPGYNLVGILDERARNADLIDDVLYNSDDSYITLRTIYLQRRDAKIFGKEAATEALPDIFDEEAPSQ